MPHRNNIYDSFAESYDQDNHKEVASAFFQSVKPYIKASGKNSTVLDLGCGSGLLTMRVASMGRTVIGIDSSERMLQLAQEQSKKFRDKVTLRQADLTALPKFQNCSLALMCADITNHFTSQKTLIKVFTNVQRTLDTGGLFIFDALNHFCFEHYWADKTYFLESKTGDLVMECSWNPSTKLGKAVMVAFVKQNRTLFTKRTTVLVERLYEDSEIRHSLRVAGFRRVEKKDWSPWTDQKKEPSLDRTLWFAYK